jgi:hypothetical protein
MVFNDVSACSLISEIGDGVALLLLNLKSTMALWEILKTLTDP